MKKMTSDNRGLSLIELLLAIVVLGIVCIPLINTFINSAKINRNAARVHSASTLAQSIMEEYKASTMETILEDVSLGSVSSGYLATLTPDQQKMVSENEESFVPYVFYQTGLTAANGHVYDARITLNPTPYSSFDLTVSNASNTNTVQIPALPEVDHAKSAVISKQLNSQDNYNVSGVGDTYTAEKKILELFSGYKESELRSAHIFDTDLSTTLRNISSGISKEIVVTIDDDSAYVPDKFVLVTCDVIYHYNYRPGQTPLIPNPSVKMNVYQAMYSVKTDPASDDPTVENIEGRLETYVFWTPSCYNLGNDKITFHNLTPYRMDMYLIKQDGIGGDFRTIFLNDGVSTPLEFKPGETEEHKDGRTCKYNINLISNLGVEYSKIYEKDAKLRVYEVTVEIFEGNGVDVYDASSTAQVTSMTSTKEVY